MHVFVPLVSVHFGVSKYINAVECPIARTRLGRKEIEVIPIYGGKPSGNECDWLMELQRLPPGDKSWAESYREFQQYDFALAPIRDGLGQVIERARKLARRT